MKRILILLAAAAMAVCCTENKSFVQTHPSWEYNSVVYEMNVRQYTPEGTLAAAQAELPRLKELGIDIVWLMPIYPIGVEGRKGTLGSYYAISDYCNVNPEFGTLADFDSFLDEAHNLGMKVILDWVANHTSPDAKWINEKPLDWYKRDSLGHTIVEYDWTDIASLNYENQDMRAEMQKSMQFWINRGIDGFRCDVAYQIPYDFWNKVFTELRGENSQLYFLAEGEDPKLHSEALFDASYAWKEHHLMNDLAQGTVQIDSLKRYIALEKELYSETPDAFRLMFTSNHDENSWSGSEFERMGDAAKLMAVLTFVLPDAQPLLYTGQEVGFNHRFEFFEKDNIDSWTINEYTSFYQSLIALRHSHPAIWSGENSSEIDYLAVPAESEDAVLAFHRKMGKDNVVAVLNFSDQPKAYVAPKGYTRTIMADGCTENELSAYGYVIYVKF